MNPHAPFIIDIAGTVLSKVDRQRLQHPLVGGLILFARNWQSREQLTDLCASIKRLRSDLLICVDHEGGRVQRFKTDGGIAGASGVGRQRHAANGRVATCCGVASQRAPADGHVVLACRVCRQCHIADGGIAATSGVLYLGPGANSRVFVESNPGAPPGLQWTRVRIVGTLDAPMEDLSSRLIGAAGMSLLLDTPGAIVGQGAETLLKPVLGEGAAKLPGKVISGASGVIENGVNAGAGLLKSVLPIFPGK